MAAIFKNNPDNKVGARVKWPILKHPELPLMDLRNSVLSWVEGTLIEPMEYQVINTVEHGLIILSACAAQEVELLPPKNTDGKDFPTSDEEITQVLESHQNASVPDKYKTPDWVFEKSLPSKLRDARRTEEEYQKVAEEMRNQIKDGEELEKEMDAFLGDWRSDTLPEIQDDMLNFARHFAQWGAEHLADARKTSPKDLALTIEELELIHTFLYAVKNNKHGAFTFTRLSDEQYREVLNRFNKSKEERK